MTVLREIIEVRRPLEEAFDAVADFSSSEAWDPGVVSAERVKEGKDDPNGVGAEYRLVVTFKGRKQEMRYRTTRFQRPDIVVLEGEGRMVTALDTIAFESSSDGGTRISYTADLRLKGLARIMEPFLRGAFDDIGKKALAGMRAWLDAGSR